MRIDLDLIWGTAFPLLGSLGLGVFVYQLFRVVMPDQELLAAQQRLGVENAVRIYRHWSLKYLAPFYRALVPRIQQIKMPIYRQKKKKLFMVAGISDQFDADEFVGLKVASSILTMVVAWMFLVQMGKSIDLMSSAIALFVGFVIPDYLVRELRNKRQRAITRELPTTMDLLTLSVEAGMDFIAAISRVLGYAKEGPLKEEFSQVLKEIQLGTTRADALRNMADRCEVPAVSQFASILIQADEQGSMIGPVLRAQADMLRLERFQRAEREGARAAQKILLPLVICILPAVFIVILGPVICDIYYNQSWFSDLFGG